MGKNSEHISHWGRHTEDKHMTNAQHLMSLRRCKIKRQWDTTTHLLRWLKSKTLTIPNAA